MEKSIHCMLGQEEHTIAAQCTECKTCGESGHVRKDYPRGLKRNLQGQEQISNQVSKAAKLSTVDNNDIVIVDIYGSSGNSCNDDNANLSIQKEIIDIIDISDDDHEKPHGNNNFNVSTYGNDDASGETEMNKKRGNSGLNPKIEPKVNNHDLEPGKYNIVSVHTELFRSSKHYSTRLTQIGCVVHGSDDFFFRSIKPSGIEEYLDCYKLGGDLLQVLHMTREDDGTFLFRKQFEDLERSNKVVSVEETVAISSLLRYLEKYPNCVILGVDEETVAILVKKLGKDAVEKLSISGFTYWRRVLKYLDVDDYKDVDLEDYCGDEVPSYKSALDIAKILLNTVNDVSSQKKRGRKSIQSEFYKLCKKIDSLSKPKRHVRERENGIDHIEVYSSFRPALAAMISAEKLEQVVISSESDSEPVDSSESDSESEESSEWDSENSSSILNHKTECAPEDSSKSVSEPEETEESQVGQTSAISTTIEAETENSEVGQACEILAETEKIQIDEASVNKNMNTGESQVEGQANESSVQEDTSVKYWKLAESKPGRPGVICPGCSASQTSVVLLINIHDHIARVHTKEMLHESLVCPKCNTPVLPSQIRMHTDSGCVSPPLQCSSTSSIDTPPPVWKIKKGNNGRYGVLCHLCNGHVNLTNISTHITRVHSQACATSLQCPSCDKALLPSEVSNHVPCVSSEKNPDQPKSTPKSLCWDIQKMHLRGNGVMCPWCMHICHLYLHNLSDHVARIHKEHTGTSLQCPSCGEAVLPFDLFDHIHSSCVEHILPLSTTSKISDQSKLTSELKSSPKPSEEVPHSQTSPDQQKSILISPLEVTKPPVSSDRSKSTQISSPGVVSPPRTSQPRCMSGPNPPGTESTVTEREVVYYDDLMKAQETGVSPPQSKCKLKQSQAVVSSMSALKRESRPQTGQATDGSTFSPPVFAPTATGSPQLVPPQSATGPLCSSLPATICTPCATSPATADKLCATPPAAVGPPCATSPHTAGLLCALPPTKTRSSRAPSTTTASQQYIRSTTIAGQVCFTSPAASFAILPATASQRFASPPSYSGPQCGPQPVTAGPPCPFPSALVDLCAPQPPASAGPPGEEIAINLPPSSWFPPGLILPGMIVAEGYPSSVSRLRVSLESYISTNFCPVRGGYVHCLWMYENYQRTMMYLDQRVVVSPSAFSTMVSQICERNWGVQLGWSESRYGHSDSLFQFRFNGIMPIH